MKIKSILTLLTMVFMLIISGQNPYLVLTFTAVDSAEYVQLQNIKVMNLDQGCDTVLCWPDTVLILGSQVGAHEFDDEKSSLQVFQNYPNPVIDHTTISMYVPEKDNVTVILTDVMGRVIHYSEQILDKGRHSFNFSPGRGSQFFFTAQWRSESNSIRIISSTSQLAITSSFEYIGGEVLTISQKTQSALQVFTFSFGDELLYIGNINGLESGILDTPEENQTYTFQFANNIPCPGTPTVTHEGQEYMTIQIFSQCWLKENLNVGTMIPGDQDMKDNDILEKYCYDNNPFNCWEYGGMYQWDEMMQYTIQQSAQGICPPGWHIPSDQEVKVLEGVVDSHYQIGDPVWDIAWVLRGYDAGENLKSTGGWTGGGNGTDLFGFLGLPSGYHSNGYFSSIGDYGFFWTSTQDLLSRSWDRGMVYNGQGVHRDDDPKEGGLSVRCVKD